MMGLVELPHKRKAFVYKRLSSHEQTKKSIYSIAMQDALKDLAKEDGYADDMVIVEERDLGISGTLGREQREGLAHLIMRIEADHIESIYVVHISRLFRDQTLIDGLSFGELCKAHNVVLVMPNMRLNLRDKMHLRIYRMELERSADELELMNLRMGGARRLKGRQGFYASGSVAVGFVLGRDKTNRTYDKYEIYEPHAEIIRRIFDLFPELNFSAMRVARQLRAEGAFIPFFPPELEFMEGRSSCRSMTRVSFGYAITAAFVIGVVTNPTYIGWWTYGGEVLNKKNHPAVVEEDKFWYIQDHFASQGSISKKGKSVYSEPLILQDLLHCIDHAEPDRVRPDTCHKRYVCLGIDDLVRKRLCFSIVTWVMDDPIADYVISQCSFPEYAQTIVEQLEKNYDDAKEKAESCKRQHSNLSQEIAKLKENLAYTRTREQAQMILQMIDDRVKEKERLGEVMAYPAGRVGRAMHVDIGKVREFLTNIRTIWETQPNRFKNEFLKIIINKIYIHLDGENIWARIAWSTGEEQEIRIDRPLMNSRRENRWSERDLGILEEKYSSAPWKELFTLLPKKDYYAIAQQARRFGLRRKEETTGKSRRWTDTEDRIMLKVATGMMSVEDALAMVDRSPHGIRMRLKQMGFSKERYRSRKGKTSWEVVPIGSGVKYRKPSGANGDANKNQEGYFGKPSSSSMSLTEPDA